MPARAHAQGTTEASFVIGALLGDDIDLGFDIIEDVRATFDNSPIYGGRLGVSTWPLAFEASVLYSPSGVTTDPLEAAAADVKILYIEGNALLIFIPGPIGPFVSGGLGLHRFDIRGDDVDITENSFGWNWGGGVKLNLGPVLLRGEVRDHITKFDSGEIADLLGVANTFHNWEASASIGVRF